MTNFLHDTGTSGFLVTPFALFNNTDAAFDGLTNNSTVTSANGGSSGEFDQSHFGSAQYGHIWFIVGDVAFTPANGGALLGWFLLSTDGGTTFENTDTNTALPRPPDFVIPFTAAALNTGDVIRALGRGPNGTVELPYETCKVYVQNQTGVTLGNTTTTHAQMVCGPVADKY